MAATYANSAQLRQQENARAEGKIMPSNHSMQNHANELPDICRAYDLFSSVGLRGHPMIVTGQITARTSRKVRI